MKDVFVACAYTRWYAGIESHPAQHTGTAANIGKIDRQIDT
jgi:hypothetical protein